MASKERVNELENSLNLLGSYIVSLEDTIEKLRNENSNLLVENIILRSRYDLKSEEARTEILNEERYA